MKETDHRELLEKCIDGDYQALEAFVRTFSSLVYRCIQHVYRTRELPIRFEDIEDIHNTIFLKLFEHQCKRIKQYQGSNGCSVSSWIRILAVRMVIDHLRKERVDALTHENAQRPIEILEKEGANRNPAVERMEAQEQWRMIHKGLEALSTRDRLFIKLHCMEGLSIGDVADMLGLTVNNAHSVKHRALKRLKAATEGQENP